MLGKLIFIIFFALFTIASILLPIQIFPGSFIEKWISLPVEYGSYISAIINGLIYGTATWLIFLAIGKKIAEE